MTPANRNSVFICYSHKDSKYLIELHEHLAPSLRAHAINVWDDTRLKGGEEWREEIKKALASAKVAICLVSRAFRASEFIAKSELPPLLAAAKAEDVAILPVIVGTCEFDESELAGTQAINDPRKPLKRLRPDERDAEWVKLVRRVRELLPATTALSGSTLGTAPAVDGEAINRLGGSLSPNEMVAYAAHLNRMGQYEDAIRLLEPLTRTEPNNQLAWLEYTYALVMDGYQSSAVSAFARAYNLSQRIEHPGINDVKFPIDVHYTVFAGVGSGTYNHGMLDKPDAVYAVGPLGHRQAVFDSIGSTTVHVTNTAAEPFVAVAMKVQ